MASNLSLILFGICLGGYTWAQDHKTPLKYQITDKIQGALESRYSSKIYKILEHWPPKNIPEVTAENPYIYRAVRTPGDPDYIGLLKRFYVDRPAENLANVYDRYEVYPSLFEGLNEIKIDEVDGNKTTTSWKRSPPVFFVPSIRYSVFYVKDASDPSRVVYRYQLKSSNTISFSDGLIVIENQGKGSRATIFDFFTADWGLAKTLAPSRIWGDSIEGGIISDLSIKLYIEHPEWEFKEIISQAKTLSEKFVSPVVYLEGYDFEK